MKIDLFNATSNLSYVGTAKDGTVWVETEDGNTLFVSHNHGENWATVEPDMGSSRIVFVDDRQAFVASDGIYVSENGGQNWKLDLAGDYNRLYWDSHRKVIVAVGSQLAVKRLK